MEGGLKITGTCGMLTVDTDNIAFGCIKGMYLTGHGAGLQITEKFAGREKEINDLCMKVADACFELEDFINSV